MGTPVFCESCGSVNAIERVDGEATAACPACGTTVPVPEGYDVFVSYSTTDLARAQTVVTGLRDAGLSCWFAKHDIGVGDSFLSEIGQALPVSRVVVLVLSPASVKSPWVEREITAAVSAGTPVLPLKICDFEIPSEFLMLLNNNQWAEAFGNTLETHVPNLIAAVQRHLRQAAAAKIPARRVGELGVEDEIKPVALKGVDPTTSPYPGPRPFPAAMADKFFGRHPEAKALIGKISKSRLVLVYAPSGAGKSSLLNTLVASSLEGNGMEVLAGVRVGGAMPKDIKAADIRNIYTFTAIFAMDNTATPDPQCRLCDCLAARARKPGTRGRVIIFDQFEELFTMHAERFEDRVEFFEDVAEALERDSQLRVVVAMRQEYLADIDQVIEKLAQPLEMDRFRLNRLEAPAALEAVTGPAAAHATFADGVAEGIVKQLNTIRVPGFDGVVVEKRGEYIEMVHLQIVCERLWRSLPRGITRIEREHVQRAAGERKSFEQFVVNALDVFYDATVESVAASDITQKHGGYSKELIRLGCMKFVTTSSTRTMVQRSHGRTGRLPDWVVEQLESKHLLRVEKRGGQDWYELSHDRLAEPIGRNLDRNVSALFFAADLLDKVLERVLDERGGKLDGYFEEHRDVLKECQPFSSQVGLFPDEVEFILRAAIVAGHEMRAWSKRLAVDCPEVREAVLKDALVAASPLVRAHAATLLGEEPIESLSAALATMALEDSDAGVRRAAAESIAHLDDAQLYAFLTQGLKEEASRRRAVRALSLVRVVADRRGDMPVFEKVYLELDDRARVRRQAWWTRLVEGLSVVPYIVIPAVTLSAVTAGLFKWLPGVFGWALCQQGPSALSGLFHGITASFFWAGLIPLCLTIHRLVFFKRSMKLSALRPFGAVLIGAVAGIVTGAMVSLVVVGVYEIKSLSSMGWVNMQAAEGSAEHGVAQFQLEFWHDLLVRTRFGWAYSITGMCLGMAMALAGNALRARGTLQTIARREQSFNGLAQTRALMLEITRLALPYAWIFVALLTIGGVLAFSILQPGVHADDNKKLVSATILGLAFDCGSQVVGGFFAVVGMGLGFVLMGRGVQIPPRREQA